MDTVCDFLLSIAFIIFGLCAFSGLFVPACKEIDKLAHLDRESEKHKKGN